MGREEKVEEIEARKRRRAGAPALLRTK